MKRHRQSLNELLDLLSPLEVAWRDSHAEQVIRRLESFAIKKSYSREDLVELFDLENTSRRDFEVSMTIARLFLDLSKDEFTAALRDRLGKGIGIKNALQRPGRFFATLEEMGLLQKIEVTVRRPVIWSDLLVERLKGGRGSAIKGQRRGRLLEDFVEKLVVEIFGSDRYHARCQFLGASGISTEKADFAIPSKDDPVILIEAKAYGTTGSKQSDVLGDISRIVNEKRHDTHFLLVTDGITWRERTSDLSKLVELQNRGQITRIYTQGMAQQLRLDLQMLKTEHAL